MAKKSLILCDLGRTPICDLADNTPYSARNIVEEFSINEISSLSFDLPVVPNGKWLKLKNEMLVLFNDEYYKVKNITFKHDDGGKLYVSVECKHYSDNLSMDLISISEQTPVNVIALMKVALCYDENDQPTLGWKVGEVTVDRVAVRGLEALEQSPFSILLTIAEKFDGILKFNSQTMTVDMLERQSTTRPTLDLRVSKNLKNFSIKYDTSEMYTRLYCYGATDEDGITLDITSVNPTGKGYIDNFEYFKTIGYTEEFINSHPELFVSTNIWKDDNYYDPTDLYNDGLKELAKIAVPIVDVSISALDTKAIGLSDELTKLDLGACIRIYDEDLGVDTLCNVTKRKIDYEKPYILDATVTNSVTYHDTLSKLFTDVNTVSNVVTSGGSIIGGGGSGGGVSMDEVKEYLNVYYINAEQIEAKYAKIDELEANYVTSEYLKAHYIDAESIAAGYATIGQLHAIEAKIENLDVDYINGKLAEFEQLYADMAEFKDLVANSAEIDEIKAGELTVYGTLKATNAEVENLKATSITTGEFEAYKATIEQLFALYATIEYLEANYLKAQQIEATYAKITSLDAVSATINNLKVQVANVETLVAKKASIEDLNAVKANIETINAKLINVDKILADVITTDELKAEIAKINKLITDEINAVNATITSLDAKFATIEQLNADIANVKTLIADKANITDLEAAKADIGELEAQVANIDTILSGSIGTGTLQTIHLTAKNVVIDDAVISDLIAAKISVDQLKAGIISTNKFQVKSDDGGFKIVGNTTQWTDSNGKVRMQAGRDAEGNFNFAVFGADGTTRYFDENGIHEAGIPDGIIRDDMVANDANIQASKIQYVDKDGNKTLQTILDIQQGQIEALIKETTIDGDSLKDKFTQLEATVNGLNVTVGEVESSIDSVNSKVTQLEVTTEGLKTSVTQASTDAKEAKTIAEQTAEKFTWIVKSGTNETNFELTDRTATLVAKQINLKGLVTFTGLNSETQNKINNAETTANEANDKIDNLEIGGRNFIQESDQYLEREGSVENGTGTFANLYMTFSTKDFFEAADKSNNTKMVASVDVILENAVGYFDNPDELRNRVGMEISIPLGDGTRRQYPSAWITFVKDADPVTTNVRIVNDFDVEPDYFETGSIRVGVYIQNLSSGTARVGRPKLEFGNKATDWTPAPEDKANQSIIDNWTSDAVVNGTTTINGGYIKTQTISTDQLAVNEIFASGSSVMNIINAQEINADRITSGTINAKFLSVYGLRVLQKDTDLETLSITDQGDITMRGSVESYNYVAGKTGWSIRNDGDAEFNDVTVRGNVITNDGGIVSSGGTGRNLIKNSNFFGGTTYWQKGSNTTYAVEPDTTYGHVMKFSHTATGDASNNRIYFGTETFTHTAGVQYTLSFYVKADSACTVYAGWVRVCKPFEVGTQWIKVTSTYTPTDVGSLTFYCSLANTNVYIAMVKLEEGSVATAWSPAPEDNIKQVRFWAGTSYEQRENAPFKVYSDGSVEATQGTYSGVWTGDIRVGNISIIDPSSTSGGDASFTIRSGQNGINTVELTDIDHSTFRQSVYISDNANNTMISLGQNGSIVVNNSITVGKTKKVIIDDDSINIDGSTLSNVGNKLSVNAPAIDIGSIGSTTPIGINGNATVMGILKAVGEVNFNDVIVCKTSSNGIDFNFKE